LLTLEDYPLAGRNGVSPLRWFGESRLSVASLRQRLGIVTGDLDTMFARYSRGGRVSGLEAAASGYFATQGLFAHQSVGDAVWRGAADALARVDAGHLQSKLLTEMSAGERRRVLIARALVTNPEALLLDEPTTGLDLVARHHFMETVRRLAVGGATILLVTHHVDEVIPEMGRVLLLSGGRIAYDGLPHEVLTARRLSEVYGAPMVVHQREGYYRVEWV